MKSHELANLLLTAPDVEVLCRVDVSTCEDDAGDRVFGSFTGINALPTDDGLGRDEIVLMFE